jgi:hypothetical protein
VFFSAINVGPVPPIFYFTDQVWAEALLGRFVTTMELVRPGYYFHLEGLVGFDEGSRWVVSLFN